MTKCIDPCYLHKSSQDAFKVKCDIDERAIRTKGRVTIQLPVLQNNKSNIFLV